MNAHDLIDYLGERFDSPDHSSHRVAISQLETMLNDNGICLSSGQELHVAEGIAQMIKKYPSTKGEHIFDLLILATFVNSCRK